MAAVAGSFRMVGSFFGVFMKKKLSIRVRVLKSVQVGGGPERYL